MIDFDYLEHVIDCLRLDNRHEEATRLRSMVYHISSICEEAMESCERDDGLWNALVEAGYIPRDIGLRKSGE